MLLNVCFEIYVCVPGGVNVIISECLCRRPVIFTRALSLLNIAKAMRLEII